MTDAAVNADPTSEAERVAAIRADADGAFDAVVAAHQRPLFTFAWRYLQNAADAEELVVETFVRLYHARQRLRADTHLAPWLFTTLTHLCHNRHRWRHRHPEVSLEAAPDQPTAEAGATGSAADLDDAQLALRAAVDRLPDDLRVVILLHHYEHLSYREIGAVVGCSERGVETRLYRARQQLRADLAHHLREELAS